MVYLIYSLDFFKSPIPLYFKGKEQLSTFLGFLFSLGLIVFMLNAIITSDFFHEAKPNISIQTDLSESYAQMSFSRKNFTIVTRVANYKGVSVIDFSYFHFQMHFNSYNTAIEKIEHIISYMKICEKSDFLEEDLQLNLSGKSFCVNQTQNLNLEGNLNGNNMKYGVLSLRRCDNASAAFYNVTCKPKVQIDNFFKDKWLYLYYSNNKFDLTNLQFPQKRTLEVINNYIYPLIKKTVLIKVQKTLIGTDGGINVLDYNNNQGQITSESFSIAGIVTDFTIDDSLLHEYFFTSDSSTVVMVRRYQRFQDLLGVLGGMWSVYSIFVKLLLSHYKKFLIMKEVLYKLDILKKEDPPKEKTNKLRFFKNKKNTTNIEKYICSARDSRKNDVFSQRVSFRDNVLKNQVNNNVKLRIFESRQLNQPIDQECFKEDIINNENITRNALELEYIQKTNELKKNSLTQREPLKNSKKTTDRDLEDFSIRKDTEISLKNNQSERTLQRHTSLKRKKTMLTSSNFKIIPQKSLSNKKIAKFLEKSINLNYFQFLKFQVKQKLKISLNKKEEIIKNGFKTFYEEMDLLSILNRLQDIQKKLLLFENEIIF